LLSLNNANWYQQQKLSNEYLKMIANSVFGTIRLEKITNDIEQLIVKHQQVDAKICLYGGQVLSWQPKGQQDVFWLSKAAEFKQGKAIRGGIPLCWPWFGAFKDGGNHGFARTQVWQLSGYNMTEQGVELQLTWQGENISRLWPYPVKLTQHLFFGQHFEQRLEIENLSSQSIEYTGALHSYFNISQPSQVNINALKGVPFDCKITSQTQISDDKPDMTGPMDRIYYSGAAVEAIDTGYQRKLRLSTEHTHQWVVWNPGKEIAGQMSDVHQDGENEFFCLEAANTQWQTIEANEQASISQRIEIVPLAD